MRKHAAFTLVEVLSATALMSILMVGLIHVIGSLSPAAQAEVVASADSQNTEEMLVKLIESDLSHAHAVRQIGESLVLGGHHHLTAGGLRLHRPVRVVYEVKSLEGKSILVRRQEALDSKGRDNKTTLIAALGVESIGLAGYRYRQDRTVRLPRTRRSTIRRNDPFRAILFRDGLGPVPKHVRLTINWTETQNEPVSRIIRTK